MRNVALLFGVVLASSASADFVISADLLDPSDGAALPPPGVTCVDVYVDTENVPGTAWTVGGLSAHVTPEGVARGVSIRYAYEPDPNSPRPYYIVQPPTEDRRFTTFMTRPRPRDAAIRYTNSGAGIAGGYSPLDPEGWATATEINVAWFASPPEFATSPGVDGYIARIALETGDLTGSIGVSHFLPPDVIVLFQSTTSAGLPGTVSATFDDPTLAGTDWYVWTNIPEPLPVVSAVLGVIALVQRRA